MDETNIKKRLSIIVPVYNVEKYLERCVMSLLNQDLPKDDYEVIMVNDGSTDRSGEIAEQLASKHKNITLLTQDNKGLSGARNTGLRKATGRFIFFVDSDDWIESNFLSKIVNYAEKNNLDICFFRYVYEYNNNVCIAQPHPFKTDTLYNGEWLILHGLNISSVWQNLYSMKIIKETGITFLEGIVHEDIDFNFRLYPLAKRIMFTGLLGYHYCLYGESITRTKNPTKIAKMAEGDFMCVYNIKKNMEKTCYSKKIQDRFSKHGNSILISNLIKLIKENNLPTTTKYELINKLKELHLYPIKGKTLSWKTTILKLIINQEWLYKIFI